MSVRLPELVIGERDPRPVLSFRLDRVPGTPDDPTKGHLAVMVKHSDDPHEQTLLELSYHPTTGVLQCITRDIHQPKLAEVLNLQPGQTAKGIQVVHREGARS